MKSKSKELERLKKIELDIMQEFHDFCIAHKITYSLGFGSMLGAVRHSGFIPWDDDIDVIMDRFEFNKFLSLYDGKYKLITFNSNQVYHYAFAKLIDSTVSLIEDEFPNEQIGPYIDIFPIDYIPENIFLKKCFLFKTRILDILETIKRTQNVNKLPLKKRYIFKVGKIVLKGISEKRLLIYMDNYYKKYSIYKKKERAILTVSTTIYQDIWMKDLITINFEDRKFMMFEDYHKILSIYYGDYMKLPPIDKQVSHHHFTLK